MSDEIYYSHHEDDWACSEEEIELAAINALEQMDDNELAQVKVLTLYKGVAKRQSIDDFLSADSIIEMAQENAGENCGEVAETWMENVPENAVDELQSFISEWANKHNQQPTFFMIENIEHVEFTVTDELRNSVLEGVKKRANEQP